MRGQPGFFDVDAPLQRLTDLGDQLLAFAKVVDFETFRPELTKALAYSDGAQGGRPPFDPVTMFKVLVIQAANNLSDERTEFLINDRLSFMRFLGLGLSDRVPTERTIWLFRETAGATSQQYSATPSVAPRCPCFRPLATPAKQYALVAPIPAPYAAAPPSSQARCAHDPSDRP